VYALAWKSVLCSSLPPTAQNAISRLCFVGGPARSEVIRAGSHPELLHRRIVPQQQGDWGCTRVGDRSSQNCGIAALALLCDRLQRVLQHRARQKRPARVREPLHDEWRLTYRCDVNLGGSAALLERRRVAAVNTRCWLPIAQVQQHLLGISV
jgi:hypothetical protein